MTIDVEISEYRPALVVLCGRSFSGKSTFAALAAERLGAEIVSLDAINESRGLRGGEGIPVAEWAATHDDARASVRALLAAGRRVVLDDTSSLRFLRDAWLDLADEMGATHRLVFLDTPVEELERRVAANRRDPQRHDVVASVFADHLASFEPPSAEELAIRAEPHEWDDRLAELAASLGPGNLD
jgi:predicted kinase